MTCEDETNQGSLGNITVHEQGNPFLTSIKERGCGFSSHCSGEIDNRNVKDTITGFMETS